MPLDTAMTIRRAGHGDVPVLADVLAAAFQDDPVFAWCVPDPTRRRERWPRVFAAFADVFVPHGETFATGAGDAVALWAPPEVDPFAGAPGDAFGQRIVEVLGDEAERCFQIAEIFERHHPPQPWMYLQLMGTRPEHQGLGLGGGLLRTVLERCDASGTPAYLEATTVDNRRLYERHGFAAIGEIQLPEDGPTVWPMWREPLP
jgi:GNAT superfamily N-acetyltransferase